MNNSVRHIMFLILSIVLLSCEDEKVEEPVVQPDPPVVDQLMNWELFNTESFHNVSFPIWFNSNKIKEDSIESITISAYRFQEGRDTIVVKDTFPDEIWKFTFNESGAVEEVLLDEYVEAIHIASHEFNYKKAPDSTGYSSPVVSTKYKFNKEKSSFQGLLDQVEDLKIFDRLVFKSEDSLSLVFRNALSVLKEEHVFLKDTATWNVAFIDQNFNADGSNYYYFGNPKNFKEAFKLDNLVEKTYAEKRNYFENGLIKSQRLYDEGFYLKRNFNYDDKGWCLSLSDSIFSEAEDFIYSESADIKYTENHLPKQVVLKQNADTTSSNLDKRFLFKYTFIQ